MWKKIVLTAAVLVCACMSAASADTYVMKMGIASLNDNQHEYLKQLAEEIKTNSKGRIEVQIYPSSQLGSIPRMIEDVQFGAIQGWVGPPDFLTGLDQRYEVLTAPGVFSDMAHLSRTLQDPQFNKAFLGLGANKGLIGLSLFVNGEQTLVTRKPLHHLDELHGMKIRATAGPVLAAELGIFGGASVPMPLDQVLPALSQGAVDGSFTTISVATPLKYYTIAPYAVNVPTTYVGDIAVISKIWFDKLPPDLQRVVMNAGKKIGRQIEIFTAAYIDRQKRIWTSEGGQFLALSPAEVHQTVTKFRTVGPSVFKAGTDEKQMYDFMLERAHAVR